jgi:hypothetical protein
MLDTKRATKEIIDAMAVRNVFIGRAWPAWPTHVRITVGTRSEMQKFQAAFQEVMQGKPAQNNISPARDVWASLDGLRVPADLENS